MISIPRAALAAAVLAVVPASAAVTPTTLAGPSGVPVSGVLPAGDVVAWTTFGAVPATRASVSTGGVWSAPAEVAPAPAGIADVATGGGSTLAAAVDAIGTTGALRVFELGAGGAWTVVPGLDGATARGGTAIAVNARGEALVAWASRVDASTGTHRVFVAWRHPGGAWSAPRQLGAKTSFAEGEPGLDAALDDSGRGTVAWTARGRRTAAVGNVSGRWAAPRTHGAGDIRVVAAGTRTLAAWVGPDRRTIRAATMGAFRLSRPRTVLRTSPATSIADAYPAIGPDGTALIAYTPQRLRAPFTVRRAVVLRTRAGAWSRPEVLSAPAPTGSGIPWTTASVAADGTLAVAWRRPGRVEARTARPGGTWTAVTPLGTGNRETLPMAAPGRATGARIAWADAGRAVRVVDLPSP
ncbi:MAG: hypothetical protein IT200_05970 [Thermoleophilia bacterium]|nr:hypothetical protein [Thermoleophilia bacterium]